MPYLSNAYSAPYNTAKPSLWRLTALDIRFWFYTMGLFTLGRGVFIWVFAHEQAATTSLAEYVTILMQGMRFDATWATVFMLFAWVFITWPTFLFLSPYQQSSRKLKRSQHTIQTMRLLWGTLVTGLIGLISVVTVEYYREYHDVFNEFLFGMLFDDTWAIIKTLVNYYHLFPYLALLSLGLLLFYYVLGPLLFVPHRQRRVPLYQKPPSLLRSLVYTLLFVVFVVAGFRGGLGRRPVQLKDAGVSQQTVLNKAVLNPFTALRYAIKAHHRLQSGAGLGHWLAGGEHAVESTLPVLWAQAGLPAQAQHTVTQTHAHKPRHIFLMVMESYDSWPMLPQYQHFQVAEGLKSLAKSGIHFPNFISASHGTMSSLAAIITGLPDAQVNTNYQPSSKRAYSTAIAQQFKRLGYKTQLFYGGYLSWQRIEDFAHDQGFDRVYGASHMGDWLHTNEWGVDDARLFAFVEQQFAERANAAAEDDDTPTFNIILSTSNHPPFSVDLAEAGFDEAAMQAKLQAHPHASATAKTLGHFWYADRQLTHFIKQMDKQLPQGLFAVTGDHFSRRHVLPNPPAYETSSVPLVLYGPQVLRGVVVDGTQVAGGHLDIGATLIELAAPRGFTYASMGRNLLSKNAGRPNVGLGNGALILPNQQVLHWDGEGNRLAEHWEAYYRAQMGLAWWQIVRGS